MNAITTRLVLLSLAIALGFTLLAALGLQRAFEQAAEQALEQRLQGELYLLMAQAEVDDSGRLQMPQRLPLPEWMLPVSGRYAWILDERGRVLWAAPSTRGSGLSLPRAVPATLLHRDGHYLLGRLVRWELEDRSVPLAFVVAEDEAPLVAEVAHFRGTLLRWLGVMAVLLSLALGIGLWLGLAPLRRAGREVEEIESGQRERLEGNYPREIRGLTQRINRLLEHQQRQQQRWRHALGDLAHSLKTPLAVILGLAERSEDSELRDQARRMDRIIQYQLQRAGRAGQALEQPAVLLAGPVQRLLRTLQKVHAERGLAFEPDLPETLRVRLNEDDLMELLGNLLDNAAKWARSRVRITARQEGNQVRIRIEDDGPGIPAEAREAILARGMRLDEQRPGQGIGLAVAAEIAAEAGGGLDIGAADTGGARIEVRLPAG